MDSSLSFTAIIIGLVGGLALFLHGMHQMTNAIKIIAGEGMKRVMARLTQNRFSGVLAGALITAVIQSSSITTVLVVGFITAGLMSFSQSVSVILGANLGTTITAQIIAFKITDTAMLMVAVGFFLQILAPRERLRQAGGMLLGLGLLFLGLDLMSHATEPLRSYPPFIATLQGISNPLSGVLVGAIFTALVQSSSATTGIVIVLASQGFLSLEAGIAIIFGANIGTCVTALLSTIGKPREALQAGAVHVVFNVLGVVLWIGFIPQFAELLRALSPVSPGLDGMAQLAADTPRQIANAHTIFNLVNLLLFIGFTGSLARLVTWLIPPLSKPADETVRALYLDHMYLDQPALALDRVRLELDRMGRLVLEMARDSLAMVSTGSDERIAAMQQRDLEVNTLHAAIISYLRELSMKNLVEHQLGQIYHLMSIANYLENIGDVVKTEMVANSQSRLDASFNISLATSAVLKTLHDLVMRNGAMALAAVQQNDPDIIDSVQQSKSTFALRTDQARLHLARRLAANDPARLTAYRIETDVIENLERIHGLFCRVALQAKTLSPRRLAPTASGRQSQPRPKS